MTGQETLQMFARLRGVRECDITRIIDSVIHAVELDKYRNNLIKTYRLAFNEIFYMTFHVTSLALISSDVISITVICLAIA